MNYVMKSLNLGKEPENIEKVAEKAATDYILRVTNSLGKAKEFIEGL